MTRSGRHTLWALGLLLIFGGRAGSGFDTYWHFEATKGVIAQRRFSDRAGKIMLLGDFAPDLFYASDVIAEHIQEFCKKRKLSSIPGLRSLLKWQGKEREQDLIIRRASTFLHFCDNLHEQLDANWKLEYFYRRLLENTRQTVAHFHEDQRLDRDQRKILIIMSLGTALHDIQDFYCHTDWTHHDFRALGSRPTPSRLVPTWYEACRLVPKDANGYHSTNFGFLIAAGTYPTPSPDKTVCTADGTPKTHPAINHDNSQLFDEGASRVEHHLCGPVPASVSPFAHVQVAVEVATRASVEWVDRVMEDPRAAAAIRFARGYTKPRLVLADEVDSAIAAAKRVSCLIGHYDGANPLPHIKAESDRLLDLRPSVAARMLLRREEVFPSPFNRFWAAYISHDVILRISEGLGDRESGRYLFPSSL